MISKAKIVDIDGEFRDAPDYPVAVVREQSSENDKTGTLIVDPIFDTHVSRNLYGRIMTLVEATTDNTKMEAVKNLFSKELSSFNDDVYRSARELATGGNSSNNLYTK